MNTIRMFAFIAAVLITAVLFRVIADGLTEEQATCVTTRASAADHAPAAAESALIHPFARRGSTSP
jgi:hypothetical protein